MYNLKRFMPNKINWIQNPINRLKRQVYLYTISPSCVTYVTFKKKPS
uniref:Uncharacterized protein n=1 Tax=Anguilla anguilla TaxID=7936 RepID=A0A0E9Q7J8_ANGAN